MRVLGVAALVLLSSATLAGCTKPAPSFCCLTLEDCAAFEVDEVRTCDGEQVCVDNQCVPTPDAALIDGRPDAPGPGPDAPPDPCLAAGGQIVFATNRDGDYEIARMWADGTGFVQLTSNTWADTSPTLSHGIDRIAYQSTPTATNEVWVMKGDGSEPHLVASNGFHATWSPTTDRLVFDRDEGSLMYEVYGIDWDGSNLADLTQNNTATDWEPSWSPDSSRITFSTNRTDGLYKIYAMNADGGNQGQIRPAGRKPKWSPSGTYIAFLNAGLVRTTSTGVGETPLFAGTIQAFDWSPNSSNIVLIAGTGIGIGNVHIVRVSDANATQLSTTGVDADAHFSPDSTKVVFASSRDGNDEIYSMNVDGTGLVNLTMDGGSDKSPRWAACPQ